MKFVLSNKEKESFTEKVNYDLKQCNKKVPHPAHWDLFWAWLKDGEFETNASLQYVTEMYFEELFTPGYLNLSANDFLNQMCELYVEHRTDVAEIIADYLHNSLPKDWKTYREHRFAHFEIPARYSYSGEPIPCLYDTLTTQLEVDMPDPADPSEEYIILDGVKYCD